MGAISRTFKKATKAVKKVTKGVTKAFKKVGKGIAKVGKGIWNGVKKIGGAAFKAYGKLSSKLGPVGMIGLSMAMPYLMPGFTSAAGGLWTNFGAKMGVKATATQAGFGWANHATNPFLRTIGQIGGNIYKGTNFIKGTAQGISQTIGKTFEGFASQGTIKDKIASGFSNLYRGTSEVLTGKAGFGTMTSQTTQSALNTIGKIGPFDGGAYSSLGSTSIPTYNPNTLLQTGGIELGNVNVANKFIFDAQSAAMNNAGVFKNFSAESTKYLNTLRKVGVDDHTAYQYLRNNGVGADGVLDYSLSKDFIETGGVGAYDFTGQNIKSSFDAVNANYNMRITKPKVDGESFAESDSLLNPKKGTSKTDKVLSSLKSTIFSDDGQMGDPLSLGPIKTAQVNLDTTGYGATNVAGVTEGSLLNDAQRNFFLNQNLDIMKG
tara:strand:+ start:586 stop:1887 length:1302 start_codon:yes stop_codon:yes gene_type:complete